MIDKKLCLGRDWRQSLHVSFSSFLVLLELSAFERVACDVLRTSVLCTRSGKYHGPQSWGKSLGEQHGQ